MLSTTSSSQLPPEDRGDNFMDYFYSKMMESTNVTASVNSGNLSQPTHAMESIEKSPMVGVMLFIALMVIGSVGNIAVFTSLVRSRRRKSRVNLLMTHLAVADLIVTIFDIPFEISWKLTNTWHAGNIPCKAFMVVRAFGFYLSSNVLVCISVDRFYAVVYPLRLPLARKRSKAMLYFSWIFAFVCSFPQSIVFEELDHPNITGVKQCVNFGWKTEESGTAYIVASLCVVYFIPLLIIIVCYLCIFCEISRNSNERADQSNGPGGSRIHLRRSDERPLVRARRRTLRMTVTIITVFACCWMPFAAMTLWVVFDKESADLLPKPVQEICFTMAALNSCLDPFVYGSYALDVKSIFNRMLKKVLCLHTTHAVELSGTTSAPGTLKLKIPNTIVAPAENSTVARQHVRFEETSFVNNNGCSEPSPEYSSSEDESQAETMLKPSNSCDVFTLHHRVSIQSNSIPECVPKS